jgi:hypothetical protein
MSLPRIGSLGGVLEAVGRAAVPSPTGPTARPAPQPLPVAFDDLSPVFGNPRTVEEAKVDHAAASGWRQRSPTFGRTIGILVGVGLGLLVVRPPVRIASKVRVK